MHQRSTRYLIRATVTAEADLASWHERAVFLLRKRCRRRGKLEIRLVHQGLLVQTRTGAANGSFTPAGLRLLECGPVLRTTAVVLLIVDLVAVGGKRIHGVEHLTQAAVGAPVQAD